MPKQIKAPKHIKIEKLQIWMGTTYRVYVHGTYWCAAATRAKALKAGKDALELGLQDDEVEADMCSAKRHIRVTPKADTCPCRPSRVVAIVQANGACVQALAK